MVYKRKIGSHYLSYTLWKHHPALYNHFNGFNLIYLLTGGGPKSTLDGDIAGATDILISYTYQIAFGSFTQDLGLASAISVVIFLLVASISLYGIRKSKVLESFV